MYYFSFGANMSPATLARRGISPILSMAGKVPGYKLSFTNRGYEGVEPRFADIEPIEALTNGNANGIDVGEIFCVNGVAHKITEQEMNMLDRFEGEGIAYKRITVLFEPDNKAFTEQTDGFEVFTYASLPEHKLVPGLPSKRYIKLLVDGAKANQLNPDYCAHVLKQVKFLDCKGTKMPSIPNTAKSISGKELEKHVFSASSPSPGSSNTTAPIVPTWINMGGQIYDVSTNVNEREMLQHMATPPGGTAFALRLWRSAYGSSTSSTSTTTSTSTGTSSTSTTNNSLSVPEQEYVAAWANHLSSHYPFVGISLSPKKDGTPVAQKSKRSRNSDTTHDEDDAASNNAQKKKRKNKTKKGSSLPTTTTAAATAATTLSTTPQSWVTKMYHMTLGIMRPCVLPLRVRMLQKDLSWWASGEKRLLNELSRGIHANENAMFEGLTTLDESIESSSPIIPLTNLEYSYKVQLQEDANAFDGKGIALRINHDTGQCISEMTLPCVMTCNVAPIVL